jgi:hypothetical protein
MNENNEGRDRWHGDAAHEASSEPDRTILVPSEGAKLRYLRGSFHPASASGASLRRVLAQRVEEVDLRDQPCTCNLSYPCIVCASSDAREREREGRAGWRT